MFSVKSFLRGWFSVVFLAALPVSAQIDDNIARIALSPVAAGHEVRIEAELINTSAIDRIECAYRVFGQSEFKRFDMPLTGNTAAGTIPGADVVPPFIEYYLTVTATDGSRHTFPFENAADHPARIDVPAGTAGGDESIIILSPDPDEPVNPEQLLISVSLLRADSTVAKDRTKIFVDGTDLSQEIVLSGDLVLLDLSTSQIPLARGPHTVAVELHDAEGRTVASAGWSFRSRGYAGGGGGPAPVGAGSLWTHRASVQGETRSEDIAGVSTPYNRLTVSASSATEGYRLLGHLFLTNEEKSYRQPQNRYYIGAEASWGKAGYGDSYPSLSELILSGRRVRGFAGSAGVGPVALDVVAGDIVRNVESDTLETFSADSLAVMQERYPESTFAPYDPATNRWARFSLGTFRRNLLAVRPMFGSRENAHVGFTYLKSKDDIGSVRFGSRPQENLVFGTDFYVPFAGRTVEFSGQVAVSATNKDITAGTFSDADIDTVFSDYAQYQRDNIRRVRDILQNFITVNENLVPLNLKNLPTLAWESSLGLNTGGSTFKLTYLRRGNSYESFGQPFIRTDIHGFNLSGLVRVPGREVTVTGGIERLQDNTAQTKAATATGWTVSSSIAYAPLRSELPTVTFAYLHASNDNDLPNDTAFTIDDQMHRFMLGLGKHFTLGGDHAGSIGVSFSTRDDRSPRNADTRTTALSLSDAMTFSIPLQATFSASFNATRYRTTPVQEQTATYTTLYANAQYRLLEERLRLGATVSPTFGDLQRTLLETRAQYFFLRYLSSILQLSYYINTNGVNDTILSFILRADV